MGEYRDRNCRAVSIAHRPAQEPRRGVHLKAWGPHRRRDGWADNPCVTVAYSGSTPGEADAAILRKESAVPFRLARPLLLDKLA